MNIVIVGATGVVGIEMLKALYNFDLIKGNEITLLASKRSVGKIIKYNEDEYSVKELTMDLNFNHYDIAVFSAGGSVSKKYGPLFAENGCFVIDNSSAFRMDNDKPLIVPEINADILEENSKIIANPNCSTIQSVIAFYKLKGHFNIKSIDYATYQSVSGSGEKGIEDLLQDKNEFYNRPINRNILMQIDVFDDEGNTFEETKMVKETNKILSTNYDITATCVRVPVLYGHGVSIKIDFESEVSLEDIKKYLVSDDSVKYMYDDDKFVTPLECENSSKVYVSRIRLSQNKKSLLMFSVANNIKKGAATNAVQIAKYLIEKGIACTS